VHDGSGRRWTLYEWSADDGDEADGKHERAVTSLMLLLLLLLVVVV